MSPVPNSATTSTALPRDAAGAPVAPRLEGIRAERVIVGAEVLLALVLGSIAIGRASFFPDESYTWSTVNRGFPALVRLIVHKEAFQVLHSLLLWPVNQASDSSAALRYPSVIFFAATVPAVWALGRRLFDARTGLVAGLLLAVNAFALQFAQEARSYTMAMMFAAYAAAALAREVTDPTPWSRRAWIALSVAAVWSHGMAVFAIAALIGSLLALPRTVLAARRFVRSTVTIAVLTFPVVIAPFLQVNRAESFPDSTHPTFTTIRLFAWVLVGRSVFSLVPYLIGGAVAALAGFRIARSTGRSVGTWRFALPFTWFLFPPLFLLSFSFIDPIWIERYAIPSLGGVVVLVGYGLSRVASPRMLAAVLVCTVAAGAWGVVRWYDNPGVAAFNDLVGTLETNVRPGDTVALASDRSRIPLEFALRHHHSLQAKVGSVFPNVPWGRFKTGDQTGATLTAQAVHDARLHAKRVWLIAGFYDPDEEIAAAVRRLSNDGFRFRSRKDYAGPIVIYLFEQSSV
jgi:mannosyltransferase